MNELGLRWFRVDLRREKPDEVGPLLERYAAMIRGDDHDSRQTWKKVKAMNHLASLAGR